MVTLAYIVLNQVHQCVDVEEARWLGDEGRFMS